MKTSQQLRESNESTSDSAFELSTAIVMTKTPEGKPSNANAKWSLERLQLSVTIANINVNVAQ